MATQRNTRTKATSEKVTPVTTNEGEVMTQDAVSTIVDDAPETTSETKVSRVPEYLASNSILGDFCNRYLGVLDEILEYNKSVLAEKSSEWTSGKVLEKARELGRPTDKNVKPHDEIKSALEAYENLVNELARARRTVLDITSKELGITLSSTAERNPEVEAKLKESRKLAFTIGQQLSQIAQMTSDDKATEAVTEFLGKNPLPVIGRDQTTTFGGDSSGSTPKYRVNVTVSKDGTELLNEAGFTKTALKLSQPVFGYERGKSLKADDLRAAWEKAGNSPDKTVTNPVEFTDNGLHFVITKK